MSVRFEDQGLVLRLFPDEYAAKDYPDVLSVCRYGPGVVGKDKNGQWIDADGPVSPTWAPASDLLVPHEVHGYYIDANGNLCCADVAPRDCYFEIKALETHKQVWIVADEDGKVIEEYVLWPSLDELLGAMVQADVDVDSIRPNNQHERSEVDADRS